MSHNKVKEERKQIPPCFTPYSIPFKHLSEQMLTFIDHKLRITHATGAILIGA